MKKLLTLTLCVLFGVNFAFAQRTATGTVIDDATGETIPYVTVMVKNTSIAVATSMDGTFSISVPSTESVLQFSFLGYETLELQVNAQEAMMVRLKPSATALEGVVITGMFTRRTNTYTGSVSTIHRAELLKGGNQNILASISALDPSLLQVTDLKMGSNPNTTPNLQMRGQSVLPDLKGEHGSNPNQPLFILDGFETTITKILDLDMNLVESITTLKDATAKAIYGAKAANGVIVIETRRPQRGRMRINYTGNLNIEMPDLTSYDLCNAKEKLDVERMAGYFSTDHVENQIDLQLKYDSILRQILGGANTYWLSQPLRTGIGYRQSLFLEGGDEYMLYGVDLSHNKINGVMRGSDRSTFSGGLSLTYQVKKFQFRNRLTITDNVANESPWGSFSEYALMNPYNRIRDERGIFLQSDVIPASGTAQTNPIWNSMINTKNISKYTEIANNFYAEYTPLEKLRFTARFGITKLLSSSDVFKPASHTDFVDFTSDDIYRKGSYYKNNGTMNNLDGDLGVSYSITFGKHLLFANVMATVSSYSSNSSFLEAEGFPNDFMDDISFAVQYAKEKAPGGSESISHTLGSVASVNYSYDDRYLFDANYRLTGSSDFGADNRWGSFYSFGIGWNMHEEGFMKGLGFVDQFKLRVSTGYTGSQGFNTFDAIATMRYFGNASYNSNIGSYLVGLSNSHLSWQRKYDQNYGVDFSFLQRRFSGRFDYYVSSTQGMLTDITAPPSMGFTTYRENLGEVENKGWELMLNYRIWNNPKKREYANIYASLTQNKNTLKKISESLRSWNEAQDAIKGAEDGEEQEVITRQNTPSVRFVEGESMNAIWAVRSLGIDPANGREVFLKRNGEKTYI